MINKMIGKSASFVHWLVTVFFTISHWNNSLKPKILYFIFNSVSFALLTLAVRLSSLFAIVSVVFSSGKPVLILMAILKVTNLKSIDLHYLSSVQVEIINLILTISPIALSFFAMYFRQCFIGHIPGLCTLYIFMRLVSAILYPMLWLFIGYIVFLVLFSMAIV